MIVNIECQLDLSFIGTKQVREGATDLLLSLWYENVRVEVECIWHLEKIEESTDTTYKFTFSRQYLLSLQFVLALERFLLFWGDKWNHEWFNHSKLYVTTRQELQFSHGGECHASRDSHFNWISVWKIRQTATAMAW